MISNSKAFIKRIAFLICLTLGVAGGCPPVLAQNSQTNYERPFIVLEDVQVPVTTGGACELVPATTSQSIEVKFDTLQKTVQATTEAMIQLDIEIGNVSQVNLFEIELEYDKERVSYVEETLCLEGGVLISKDICDGKVKLLFGTMQVQDLQEVQKVMSLQFETKDNLKNGDEIQIKLNQCDVVSINDKDETQLIKGLNQPEVITIYVIEEEPTPDINKDGVVTLEDLSIAMKYYSIDSTQDLWDKAKKCDVIQDGIIDMADLIAIRLAMK
ncbi:hypothetical protein [Niameybacter massiliensis]|uniref:hypothetical protein n=1 Tax=Niameybacter massiliensis TaxID=1658108 RepID=UPI0006B67EEA|nr:hypothetical protein [Niameybacter massiliensis]